MGAVASKAKSAHCVTGQVFKEQFSRRVILSADCVVALVLIYAWRVEYQGIPPLPSYENQSTDRTVLSSQENCWHSHAKFNFVFFEKLEIKE